MSSPGDRAGRISQQDALLLLEETEGLRRDTRRARRTVWFPMVTFGAVVMGSAAFCADVLSTSRTNAYWAVAGPLGYAAVFWYYRRRELRKGMGEPIRPYLVAGGVLLFLSIRFFLPVLGGVLNYVLRGPHLQGIIIYRSVAVAGIALAAVSVVGMIRGQRRTAIVAGIASAACVVSVDGIFVVGLLFDVVAAAAVAVAATVVAVVARRAGRNGVAGAAAALAVYSAIAAALSTTMAKFYLLAPFYLGPVLLPSTAPVAALAAGLLVLAWLERSRALAAVAVVVGVLSVLSGLFIIDNQLFNGATHCGTDLLMIGGLMVAAGGVAALVERRTR